jgi:hypothetical protein
MSLPEKYTRNQLEGATRDKLRTRALDLRTALGWTEKEAPLPATATQLIEWILSVQDVASNGSNGRGGSASTQLGGYHGLKEGANWSAHALAGSSTLQRACAVQATTTAAGRKRRPTGLRLVIDQTMKQEASRSMATRYLPADPRRLARHGA